MAPSPGRGACARRSHQSISCARGDEQVDAALLAQTFFSHGTGIVETEWTLPDRAESTSLAESTGWISIRTRGSTVSANQRAHAPKRGGEGRGPSSSEMRLNRSLGASRTSCSAQALTCLSPDPHGQVFGSSPKKQSGVQAQGECDDPAQLVGVIVLAGEQGQRVTGQSVVVLSMRRPAVSSRVQSSVASLIPVPERGRPRRAVQL
jgi:hypothetical protein